MCNMIWPSDSVLRGSGYVTAVMKTLAFFLVVGGVGAGLVVALKTHGSARGITAASLIVGGVVSGSLWAWLGYVLEALMGIWLSTSDGIEEAETE